MVEESKEQMKPGSASNKSRMKVKVDQVNQSASQSRSQSTNVTARSRTSSAQSTRRVSVNQPTSTSNVTSPLGSPKQRSIEEILGFWPYKPPSLLSPNGQSNSQSNTQPINAPPTQSTSSPRSSVPVLSPTNNPLNNHPKVLQFVQENRPNDLLTYLQSLELSINRTLAVQTSDHEGNPVLFHALAPTHSTVLQILLDYGAIAQSPNQPNTSQSTPILPSIYPPINPPVNSKLNTALHIAVHYGYKKAQQTLIEFGSSLKSENWEHQQPYQMAIGQSANASVKASDRVQQAQNYLNSLYEAHTEKLTAYQASNQTINQSMLVDPLTRGCYRSLFDICDVPRLNAIPYQIFNQIITQFIEQRKEKHFAENPPPHVRLTLAEREKLKQQAAPPVVEPVKGAKGAKDAKKDAKSSKAAAAPANATPAPPTPQQIIETFFSSIDVDHNGSINFLEYLVAMLQLEADREAAKKGKSKKAKGSKKGKSKSKK